MLEKVNVKKSGLVEIFLIPLFAQYEEHCKETKILKYKCGDMIPCPDGKAGCLVAHRAGKDIYESKKPNFIDFLGWIKDAGL